MRIVTAVTTVGIVATLGLTGAHMADASAYRSDGPAGNATTIAGVSTGTGVSTSTGPGAAEPVAAATPSPTGLTLPAGGVLEHRVTQFCGRVPQLIQRADSAQTRLGGDADTKGSLARLKARQAKATANKHPLVADRLGRRIERQTTRLSNLPEVKTRLAKAGAECATLDLPTPSSSPSASTSASS